MITGFFQIAITVWISTHPVRHVLPKIYYDYARCERVGMKLARLHKTKHRMQIECDFTDKRSI